MSETGNDEVKMGKECVYLGTGWMKVSVVVVLKKDKSRM